MREGLLETQRLRLRPLTDDDLPALCAILQDPVAMRAYEHAFSDEEAREWLARQQRRRARDGLGLMAVCLKDTGEMVGQCGVTWQDTTGATPDVYKRQPSRTRTSWPPCAAPRRSPMIAWPISCPN